MSSFRIVVIVSIALLVAAQARDFTDSTGRRIDAELIDVRGDNVLLKRNGKTYSWPVRKLSAQDRLYVATWKATHETTSARVGIQLWEREGMGPSGVFDADNARAKAKKGPPIITKTKQRASYVHYEVILTNDTNEDVKNLTLSYVVFLIDGAGRLIPQSGSTKVERLSPKERVTKTTRGATLLSTKTVTTQLSIHRNSLKTSKDTARSQDRFGGVWVRVYSGSQIIGEKRDLARDVEKLDPTWTGPAVRPVVSIPELLKALPLPKLPDDLPALPKPPFNRP